MERQQEADREFTSLAVVSDSSRLVLRTNPDTSESTAGAVREIELELEECSSDLPKYQDFDIMTRRYIQYCKAADLALEAYLPGVNLDELTEKIAERTRSRERSMSPEFSLRKGTTIKPMKPLPTDGSKSGDEKQSTSADEVGIMDGALASQSQKEFANYLKLNNMREYGTDTVIFYEDEFDKRVKLKTLNQSAVSEAESTHLELDYDFELLNELFSPEPDRCIRVSKDHKFENANFSRIEHSNSLGNHKRSGDAFDLGIDLSKELENYNEEYGENVLDYEDLYEEAEQERKLYSFTRSFRGRRGFSAVTKPRQTRARRHQDLEYFMSIVRKKQKLSQGDGLQAKIV